MNLIKEQDHVAGFFDFIDQLLHIFLKAAPVLRPGFQTGNVDTDDLLVFNCGWHVAVNDSLGQSFNDRRLTNTGITDQDWIVLDPTAEDFRSFLNFFVTANHWIQFASLGFFG